MAGSAVATTLELHDIQALVLRGHPDLPWASYVFFRVVDPVAARAALRALLHGRLITTAAAVIKTARAPRTRLQLALSHAGLERLGLPAEARSTFAVEFQGGMAESARTRRLGDRGASAPEHWKLGGSNHQLHVLVCLFAKEEGELDALVERTIAQLGPGLALERREDSAPRRDGCEHFGFRDGISQPVLRSDPTREHVAAIDRIADGEFLFGYCNEYDQVAATPRAGKVDLGRNGTYLVFRKLEQDVAAFWRYFYDVGGGLPSEAERLAAKCVGRWPSGAPLALAPDRDDPRLGRDAAHNNEFLYAEEDPLGMRCPIAAHIRRANPRDAKGDDAGDSVTQVRRRRILRRGRLYGTPPDDPRPLRDDGVRRGLYFIALNVNLGRQFEFLQQTWLNNPKFGGLVDDRDPVTAQGAAKGMFSLPALPFRRRLAEIPSFITVRGGEYFFLPGLQGLAQLLDAC